MIAKIFSTTNSSAAELLFVTTVPRFSKVIWLKSLVRADISKLYKDGTPTFKRLFIGLNKIFLSKPHSIHSPSMLLSISAATPIVSSIAMIPTTLKMVLWSILDPTTSHSLSTALQQFMMFHSPWSMGTLLSSMPLPAIPKKRPSFEHPSRLVLAQIIFINKPPSLQSRRNLSLISWPALSATRA